MEDEEEDEEEEIEELVVFILKGRGRGVRGISKKLLVFKKFFVKRKVLVKIVFRFRSRGKQGSFVGFQSFFFDVQIVFIKIDLFKKVIFFIKSLFFKVVKKILLFSLKRVVRLLIKKIFFFVSRGGRFRRGVLVELEEVVVVEDQVSGEVEKKEEEEGEFVKELEFEEKKEGEVGGEKEEEDEKVVEEKIDV